MFRNANMDTLLLLFMDSRNAVSTDLFIVSVGVKTMIFTWNGFCFLTSKQSPSTANFPDMKFQCIAV